MAVKSILPSVNHFLIGFVLFIDCICVENLGLSFFVVRNARSLCLLQSIFVFCNATLKNELRKLDGILIAAIFQTTSGGSVWDTRYLPRIIF
jgi:hypothetical protein